jgi:biopolymer transport protein ExbD
MVPCEVLDNGLAFIIFLVHEVPLKVPKRQAKKTMDDEAPITITVPEAGKRYFDMSRGASYAAAERGDIPTINAGCE